uniref:SIAH-type domain-containing protein n=1 Tax=Triticum aestivum TaxID=4565 RepID=A0A077RVL5_WHEAT|nr:unnamed protein product [Triticum aestivum]
MGEQQQHKKRPRCSASAEGSGGKKSSVLALSSSPVATAAPSAPAAPSPVATAKQGPAVAVTSPLAAMPPAPAAPSPAATTEGDMTTPAATVVVTSPVAAMAPAPAAPGSAAMVVDLEPTSPVATVKPVRVVKPEDEVAEQEDAAMLAGAAEDVEVAILALPKKSFHCAACLCPLKPPVFRCENEHFVCHACGGDGGANKRCGPCGRDVSYTHSRFMNGVVDAYKEFGGEGSSYSNSGTDANAVERNVSAPLWNNPDARKVFGDTISGNVWIQISCARRSIAMGAVFPERRGQRRQEVERRGASPQSGGHRGTGGAGAQPRCHGKASRHRGGDHSSGRHAADAYVPHGVGPGSSGTQFSGPCDARCHGRGPGGDQSSGRHGAGAGGPSPVAIVKPVRVVKPEDEGAEVAEQEHGAMAEEEGEAVNLDLPKKLFHCAACPGPLRPPVVKCENEHLVCHACGGDGDGGGGATKHCVACPYKRFGCARSMAYHSAADHAASCRHAPCYCFDCRFDGSPVSLVRHLTARSGQHSWPVEKIEYEVAKPFVVPASSEDQRRLLVAEDNCVFLLGVGAGRDPGGRRPVNVVCVRGNARPLYTGVLWVDGPPAAPGQPLTSSFQLKAMVASCSVPGAVDMEQGWLHAHANPNMLHGESGELHLRLCLTKLS